MLCCHVLRFDVCCVLCSVLLSGDLALDGEKVKTHTETDTEDERVFFFYFSVTITDGRLHNYSERGCYHLARLREKVIAISDDR